MKTIGRRSLVIILLAAGFFFGLGFFLRDLFLHGGFWAVQPFNGHLNGGGTSASEGRILDRKGVVLAETKDGKRVYNSDLATRCAMLHAVGDTNGYISTSVQYNFRGELSGYSPVTGLASPTGRTGGGDVTLTLSSGLCRLAREKLDGRNGAAAVVNYKTGEMLCMVSTPDFDPQDPPEDLNTNKDYNGAYLNKVLSSAFTPGSIFKVVTSAAAIENIPDLETRAWDCGGSVVINGNKITDVQAYGKLNFRNALAKSSNVAFGQIAVELGGGVLAAEARQMGFNRTFSIDGIPTAASVYSVSGASDDQLAWSGVGQYTDLANPFHMLLLMDAAANGGTPVMPYFISGIRTGAGLPSRTGSGKAGPQLIRPATAEKLKDYLRYDVTHGYGDDLFPGLSVCAKTGTAEVGGGKNPNCWMIGFSSDEKTPLAFVVLVEDSAEGSVASAGRIASALMAAAAELV